MPRLRIGIGRPSGKTPVERHVLGRFSKEEQTILNSVLVQSVDLLLTQLTEPQLQASPPGGRRGASRSTERKPQELIEEQTQNWLKQSNHKNNTCYRTPLFVVWKRNILWRTGLIIIWCKPLAGLWYQSHISDWLLLSLLEDFSSDSILKLGCGNWLQNRSILPSYLLFTLMWT